ncbi:helix-turn-helix transcriptional regulator [Paenibacillus chibensis]|uniref:Helix-turn-helix transcriptional regulator n=1 Tax=Paenibacillus chibensis TaxID=59846 RepID=A0ABU6PYR2_9BACL|nr:helix-turn-helix transcriptional regulator [Paenibacillus chibensis]
MSTSPKPDVGLTPKQARLLRGLTQKEVAALLDVHKDTYMKWERDADRMPVGKAKEFSSIVGWGVDEIFFTAKSTLSG